MNLENFNLFGEENTINKFARLSQNFMENKNEAGMSDK